LLACVRVLVLPPISAKLCGFFQENRRSKDQHSQAYLEKQSQKKREKKIMQTWLFVLIFIGLPIIIWIFFWTFYTWSVG
jgi:cytoskeletal protein RodZ